MPEDQLPPVIRPPEAGEPVDIDALVAATSATVLARVRTDPAYRGQVGLTGPPCDPADNPACVGPEGDSGEPGKNGLMGVKGEAGENGEPPASYTIPNPDIVAEPGSRLTCSRDSGSSDDAPTYTCN